MALMELQAALLGVLVYWTGPLWGAPATRRQRLFAALAAGVLGALAAILMRPQDRWWFMPIIGLLVIVAVVDRLHQIIPNRLVLLVAVWALAARFYYGHWISATLVAAGIFLFYLAVNLLTRGGLGMGDVKFAAVLALALGYPAALISVVFGMWAAGFYALYLVVMRRQGSRQLMALGPFLVMGGFVGLFLMIKG
jgi:Flp pilus assembly protein protease CpaA